MKILITSGGTKIPIDQVRHIDNMSSGTFGSRIAMEALNANHDVVFFKRKNSKSPFQYSTNLYTSKLYTDKLSVCEDLSELIIRYNKYANKYSEYEFETFDEYRTELLALINKTNPDVVILSAAVSDYGIDYVDGKIRSKNALKLQLIPLSKVINEIKKKYPMVKLVGFKLLVNSTKEELISAAVESIEKHNCEFVVANDLSNMKKNNHSIYLVSKSEVKYYESDKNDANFLAKVIINKL